MKCCILNYTPPYAWCLARALQLIGSTRQALYYMHHYNGYHSTQCQTINVEQTIMVTILHNTEQTIMFTILHNTQYIGSYHG